MKKSNKVYSQILNSANDAEYLRVGYYPGGGFPGGPSIKRG